MLRRRSPTRRVGWLISTLAVLTVLGCRTSLTPNLPSLVRVTGTVRHFSLEGGFWAVRGDDSTTYDPLGGLPLGFQRDGLRVRLEAKIRSDLVSAHMAGPIVEIVSIQAL